MYIRTTAALQNEAGSYLKKKNSQTQKTQADQNVPWRSII